MNKKGFTLVELLAVIALLGIILIIVIPNYNNLFGEGKNIESEIQKNEIENATKLYLEEHCINPIDDTYECDLELNNSTYNGEISSKTLINEGYIDENELKNDLIISVQNDKIEVKKVNYNEITLNKTFAIINVNDTLQLIAKLETNNETDKQIIWNSSNTNIATIKNGLVTGKNVGKVIITAKTSDGKIATSTIEITNNRIYYAKFDSIVRKRCSDSDEQIEFNASSLKYDGIVSSLIKGTAVEILEETDNYYKVRVPADNIYYVTDKIGYVIKTSLSTNIVDKDKAKDRSLSVSYKTMFIRNIINIGNATDSYQETDNLEFLYPTSENIQYELGGNYECLTNGTCSNDSKYQEAKTKLRITGYNRIINNDSTFISKDKTNKFYISCAFFADVIYDGTYKLDNVKSNGDHYLIGTYLSNANLSDDNLSKKYYYVQQVTTQGDTIDINKMQTGDSLIGQTEGTEGHIMLYIGDGIIVHSTNGKAQSKYDANTSIHFTTLTSNHLTLGKKWKNKLNVIRIKKGIVTSKYKIEYKGNDFIITEN